MGWATCRTRARTEKVRELIGELRQKIRGTRSRFERTKSGQRNVEIPGRRGSKMRGGGFEQKGTQGNGHEKMHGDSHSIRQSVRLNFKKRERFNKGKKKLPM